MEEGAGEMIAEEISEDTVGPLLETRRLGRRIHAFQACESTNLIARRLLEGARRPEHGTLIVTEFQNAGYGRNARAWQAAAGSSLLFSLILYPEKQDAEFPFHVTMAAAVSVLRALRAEGVSNCSIKWPNDVLTAKGRKLSGILTEQVTLLEAGEKRPVLILGIGVNVNQLPQDFAAEIRETASSARMEARRGVSRLALLKRILEELESCLEMGNESLFTVWQRHCSTLGRTVRVRLAGRVVTGQALAFERDGSLVLRHPTGQTEAIYSGDVEELRMDER